MKYKESKELSQLKEEEEESRARIASQVKEGPPDTLFLKSRGKVFYLYREPEF